MGLANFIYRQKQKWRYHTSLDPTLKRLAEINRYESRIIESDDSYLVKQLNLKLPKTGFEFVFGEVSFELFITNAVKLYGTYEVMDQDLIFKFSDYKFLITSRSEVYIINEIFVENCYRFLFNNDNRLVVIDIGMNVGLASVFFAAMECVEKVYAFEPFTPTYELGLRNLKLNKHISEKIATHSIGLGLNNELKHVPYEQRNKGINTSLIQRNKQSTDFEKIKIESAQSHIRKICSENRDSEIVLKIDTEGSEYQIIESLSQADLPSNIKIIMMEWHFKGSLKIEEYLQENGFKLISTTPNQNSGIIYAIR